MIIGDTCHLRWIPVWIGLISPVCPWNARFTVLFLRDDVTHRCSCLEWFLSFSIFGRSFRSMLSKAPLTFMHREDTVLYRCLRCPLSWRPLCIHRLLMTWIFLRFATNGGSSIALQGSLSRSQFCSRILYIPN